MKFIFKGLWVTLLLCNTGLADTVGHGGDPLAKEFIARGRVVLDKIKNTLDVLTTSQMKVFEAALLTTRVELTEEPVVDSEGGVVTSVVLPDPLHPGFKYVRLNKPAWRTVLNENLGVNQFVFHEYLRVIGVEDSHYEVSLKLGRVAVADATWISIETLVSGALVPASAGYSSTVQLAPQAATREYTRNNSGEVESSRIVAPGYMGILCYSSLKWQDEQAAKGAAFESFFDTKLNWYSQKRNEILADWRGSSPIHRIDFDETATNHVAVEMDDDTARQSQTVTKKLKLADPRLGSIDYSPHFFAETEESQRELPRFNSLKQGDFAKESDIPKGFCPAEIGFQQHSVATIHIYVFSDKPIRRSKRPHIQGNRFSFLPIPASSPTEIVTAIKSAEQSFRAACANWKDQMAQKLGANLVYADCGLQRQIRDTTPTTQFSQRQVYFESSPSVFYTEEH